MNFQVVFVALDFLTIDFRHKKTPAEADVFLSSDTEITQQQQLEE